mmetsp:Transcript_83720/g.194743  ORF Transcript_83720/g.194743 Transcript_83720/m.194743 type:complete len:483 (-) Transcript_83720:88-1536(-)
MKRGFLLLIALLAQGSAFRAQRRHGLQGWQLEPFHTMHPEYMPTSPNGGSKPAPHGHEGHEAAHKGSGRRERSGSGGGDAHEAKEHGEKQGKTLAILMVSSLICGSGVFALTQTKLAHVSNSSILVVDQVVAIFLAVLWFDAFDDVLDEVIHEHAQVTACVLHAIIILTCAVIAAWNLRSTSFGLASFCTVGAHFVGFMGQHSALEVQEGHFSLSPVVCALGLLAVGLGIFVLCALLFFVKKRAFGIDPASESSDEHVKSFVERFDDVENDFAAMTLSSYWTMTVRFIIVKQYPEEEIEPGTKPDHNELHRHLMLLHSGFVLFAGTFLVDRLSQLGPQKNYVLNRAVAVLKAFTILCWAFSFLVWAQMVFYEHPEWSGQPMLMRVAFAAGISLVGGASIVAFSRDTHQTGARAMLLRSTAIIVGMAWEEAFDAALEILFEGSSNAHLWKGLSAILCTVAVFPSYWVYWKPYALAAEENERTD